MPVDCVTARRNEPRSVGGGWSRGDYALACFIFRILKRPHLTVLGNLRYVRVLARDVSLAQEHPERTSILNLLRGRVDEVADDDHPGSALVRIQVGSSALIARVTKRSAAALGIAVGQEVWVQVKSVAVME
ncbi:MAG: hypothetical protein GY734_07035 [Herbaspirillum sp.]|nr:hypothetical protein [Herbaspirillum sp.]MCP3950450.1 hypothetical protein [Herbaspirillum sp.]MCP4030984.1 hypothetical protein [Herbaspirillum sp.]MRT30994.1 hypothetical protein [Herbaspirillum sp. CAH-3]